MSLVLKGDEFQKSIHIHFYFLDTASYFAKSCIQKLHLAIELHSRLNGKCQLEEDIRQNKKRSK